MKHLASLILALLSFIGVFANPVDDSTAKAVGLNFLAFKVNSQKLGIVSDLKLAYKASDENANTCFYVFNTTSAKGFVIVSADDNAKPILGYSDESNFDTTNMPIQLKEWFGGYTKQISSIIKNKTIATDDIKNKWQELKTPPTKSKFELFGATTFGIPVVSPLIQTTWDQDPYYNGSTGKYNALCPYDSSYGQRCVTGCVATAMAQVMKYWNYPTKGIGFNSYTPTNTLLGIQSANFGNTTYQWDSMPDYLTKKSSAASINAIATLIYHCGVSVNMDYGATESTSDDVGSAPSAQNALVKYFGYSNSLQGIYRADYTDAQWINIIEGELNTKRPVMYGGSGTGGGHSFVADGYDNNNLIHFNWGWSGESDGYFEIDSLNPGTLGTGGGTGGFNDYQDAIIGIQPSTASTNSISLYNTVTTSASSIYYGNSFSVTTNLINTGTSTFSGDYCAAAFDANFNFVGFVQILSSKTLQANYHYNNNLTFSTSGIYEMTPGTYTIGIYYRPTGGNWVAVSDYDGYTNFADITVVNGNTNIELYAPIIATPTTFTKGQPASVSLNILNNQWITTFYGEYQVNLYNLDGSFAQTIGTYHENNGLAPSYHYNNNLVFSKSSINVKPGTYILAAIDSSNGSGGSWEYTGSGSYTNPVLINVLPTPLQPDKYEPNDSVSEAYLLPLNFVNDKAYVNTQGSNLNSPTDNDYYKIVLPTGYKYTVKPVLNDENYSDNDSTYTLNGLFSMSLGGIKWSNAFQDTLTPNISFSVKADTVAQTLYFHVAPFYQGLTGTYLLEVNVTRVSTVPVTLDGFEAEAKHQDILLNWHTATELNTSHFIIQHSTDGTSFTGIGTVKAIGSGANSYSFTDNNPANGTNYYRLQSMDKDGAASYSKVVSVQFTVNSNQLTVYPNPSRDNVTISGNHIVSVQMIDNMGRVVKVVSLKDATNPTLSVSSLPAGVYHLRIQTTDGGVIGAGLIKE